MVLDFKLQDGKYVAYATALDVYNLHIERSAGGGFQIFQSGYKYGEYAECDLSGIPVTGSVIDWTFNHGYYPMRLKFVSDTEVISGYLSSVVQ